MHDTRCMMQGWIWVAREVSPCRLACKPHAPPPTCPLQAELQKQLNREKALAEAEGRIKENRENEDINRRAALLKYQEETRKAIEVGWGGGGPCKAIWVGLKKE